MKRSSVRKLYRSTEQNGEDSNVRYGNYRQKDRRFLRMVCTSRPKIWARRLCSGQGMHDFPRAFLRCLGEGSGSFQQKDKVHGPQERVLPTLNTRELPEKRSRTLRRIRA